MIKRPLGKVPDSRKGHRLVRLKLLRRGEPFSIFFSFSGEWLRWLSERDLPVRVVYASALGGL
jgi:hypothetical protein